MGRQLPWARKPNAGNTDSATAKDKFASRASGTANLSEDVLGGVHGQATTARTVVQRKRALSRSPSSSPPPGPPPISPLRPGYDNDDIYVMVEDEFWSVAQSYTAHLHRAEYKRLMSKAKEAPPREVSDLSPSRPREVRDRVRRDALRRRQHSALDEMAGRKLPTAELETSDNDDRDGGSAVSGKMQRIQMQVTGLERLMGNSEQTKTSLVGLERLPSATRAAKGYGKGNTASSQTISEREDDFAGLLSGTGRRGGRHGNGNTINMNHSAVSENDGEDVQRAKRKPETRVRPGPDVTATIAQKKSHAARPAQTTSTSSHRTFPRRNHVDALEDELDDDDDDETNTFTTSWNQARNPKPASGNKSTQLKNDKKDRRSRLDEVPMFMF